MLLLFSIRVVGLLCVSFVNISSCVCVCFFSFPLGFEGGI